MLVSAEGTRLVTELLLVQWLLLLLLLSSLVAIARCPLPVARRLSLVVRRPSSVARRSLSVAYRPSLARRSSLVALLLLVVHVVAAHMVCSERW
jgi:hypothetical protein